MILVSAEYRDQSAGVCLMRTQTLGDPKSWRAWDGEGFNVRFIDPYRDSAQALSPPRVRGALARPSWAS